MVIAPQTNIWVAPFINWFQLLFGSKSRAFISCSSFVYFLSRIFFVLFNDNLRNSVTPDGINSLSHIYPIDLCKTAYGLWRQEHSSFIVAVIMFAISGICITFSLHIFAARLHGKIRSHGRSKIFAWIKFFPFGIYVLYFIETTLTFIWFSSEPIPGISYLSQIITVSLWRDVLQCILLVAIAAVLVTRPFVQEVFRIGKELAVPLFFCLAAPLLLLLPDQSAEAIRALAEDRDLGRIGISLLIAAWFGFNGWIWARALTYVTNPSAMNRARRYLRENFVPTDFAANDADQGRSWAALHLPRFCAWMPLFLFALAVWNSAPPLGEVQSNLSGVLPEQRHLYRENIVWLRVGAVVLFFMSAFACYAVALRRHWIERKNSVGSAGASPNVGNAGHSDVQYQSVSECLRSLDASTLSYLVFSSIFGVAFFAVSGFNPAITVFIGPVAILVCGLGLIMAVCGSLTLMSHISRIPLIPILLTLAVIWWHFDLNDNHLVGAHAAHSNPTSGSDPGHNSDSRVQDHTLPVRNDLNSVFNEWLKHRPYFSEYQKQNRSYPVLFIAAEGGGIRAAYQTAYKLAWEQDQDTLFASHIFAISGVSGGSMGAAVFAASCTRYLSQDDGTAHDEKRTPGEGLFCEVAKDVFRTDLLSPPLTATMGTDLLQRFLPFPVDRWDRARALQQALERSYGDAVAHSHQTNQGINPHALVQDKNEMKESFSAVTGNFTRGRTPALFFNTTSVETGDRIVISSLPFTPTLHSSQEGKLQGGDGAYYIYDLKDVAPAAELSLSEAACLSARFPFITPAGYVIQEREPGFSGNSSDVRRKIRLADGGYFDNSGVSTVADILMVLRQGEEEREKQKIKWHPIVVRIGFGTQVKLDAGPIQAISDAGSPRDGCAFVPGGSVWTHLTNYAPSDTPLTPFETYVNAANARGRTAFGQFSLLLSYWPRASLIQVMYHNQTGYSPLPLGWMLSRQARENLSVQAQTTMTFGRLSPNTSRSVTND